MIDEPNDEKISVCLSLWSVISIRDNSRETAFAGYLVLAIGVLADDIFDCKFEISGDGGGCRGVAVKR